MSIIKSTFGFGLILLLPVSLAACATPEALSDQAVTYNEAVAEAADSQLLLNIIRAAYRNPVHYTAISQLRDARSRQVGFQIAGQFPFDKSDDFAINPTLSGSGSHGPSFDVVPLDNRAAALGLFRPIEAQTFITYWQQDWPQNVLLSLFVDILTMNEAAIAICNLSPAHEYKEIDNAAYTDEAFKKAQEAFNCIRNYLDVIEEPSNEQPVRNTIIAPEAIVQALPGLSEQKFSVTQSGSPHIPEYTIERQSKRWKMVLDVQGKQTLTVFGERGKPQLASGAPMQLVSLSDLWMA